MTPVDTTAALLLAIGLLVALAVSMPFTGGRAARRRAAWERFDSLIRIRGIGTTARDALVDWARVSCEATPYNVLVRRKDFDRFARSEVQRLRSLPADAFEWHMERLSELRGDLGFDRTGGQAQSTHDLEPGELLNLRYDDGRRLRLRVTGVGEEGIHVGSVTAREGASLSQGPGWATFAREGEGSYRFRTASLGGDLLDHGTFLVMEDRRRDPRIELNGAPFWIAVERLPDGAAPEDPEGVEVEALDVSLGGLALLADREVRKGSELGLDLPLGPPGGPVLRGLRANVLGHGYRQSGARRPHFLHCSFLALPEPQQRVLEAFVYQRTADNGNGTND